MDKQAAYLLSETGKSKLRLFRLFALCLGVSTDLLRTESSFIVYARKAVEATLSKIKLMLL